MDVTITELDGVTKAGLSGRLDTANVNQVEMYFTASIMPKGQGTVVDLTDVSFIGLAKALPAALGLAAEDADLIALVKPQFEVGPERVGKGGLVKDDAARTDALAAVAGFLEGAGWIVRAVIDSPILGGDGNQEYLLWATKKPPSLS